MASYETAGQSDEWYTPSYIFEALDLIFDMDVAAPACGPLNVPCARYLTQSEDGLAYPWAGMVWMNPPFGHQKQKRQWLDKFFKHGFGIALVPDRTSAPWWQEYAPKADLICFMSPKVKFVRADGSVGESPGTGTCLFAVGGEAVRALRNSGLGIMMVPV